MSKTFRPLEGLQRVRLREGITARAINGERMTMAVVDLDADVGLPEHSHESEQLGFILSGSMTMTIGGEERELNAGDTYTIPSRVPHDAVAGPEGCTVVDVFAPIRADWEKLEHAAPEASTRWP